MVELILITIAILLFIILAMGVIFWICLQEKEAKECDCERDPMECGKWCVWKSNMTGDQ